jgi:hypothetical protein
LGHLIFQVAITWCFLRTSRTKQSLDMDCRGPATTGRALGKLDMFDARPDRSEGSSHSWGRQAVMPALLQSAQPSP